MRENYSTGDTGGIGSAKHSLTAAEYVGRGARAPGKAKNLTESRRDDIIEARTI